MSDEEVANNQDQEDLVTKPIKRHVAPSRPKKNQDKTYYIGQAELREEIEKYFASGTDATNRTISNNLAQMLIKIATRFASKPCFYRYTYKQEFIDEAIYRMVYLLGNINLNHPRCNPFSYLTSICYSAFASVLKKYARASEQLRTLRNQVYEDFCTTEGITAKKELDDLIYAGDVDQEVSDVVFDGDPKEKDKTESEEAFTARFKEEVQKEIEAKNPSKIKRSPFKRNTYHPVFGPYHERDVSALKKPVREEMAKAEKFEDADYEDKVIDSKLHQAFDEDPEVIKNQEETEKKAKDKAKSKPKKSKKK